MTILIVNLERILDESKMGKDAATELRKDFDVGKEKYDDLKNQAKSAQLSLQKALMKQMQEFEGNQLSKLETRRTEMRASVYQKARACAEAIRADRGATAVIDDRFVMAADESINITADVIAALDAL